MKKVILVVIDGLGLRSEIHGNAFQMANTPFFDKLFSEYPNTLIQASGEYVGLPDGQIGNSEVGHLNIGAGRVVYTGLSLINKALKDDKFKENQVFLNAFNKVKENNSTLHLMGLLSPGGVHSLEDHLFEILKQAHNSGVENVAVHVFGDGRDVAPKSIRESLEKLQELVDKYGYKIATISGRFYSMDRDKMFDRTEKAYKAILGKSGNEFSSALEYLDLQYSQNITDEFLEPAKNSNLDSRYFLKDNDAVIFFNFRPDRARQLSHLILNSSLYDYQPSHLVKVSDFVSMMKYEGIKCNIAYEEMLVNNPIGKVFEDANKTQLRVAETQKYAHVTYFMDGGVDVEYKNSKRIMVDSLKVESYADTPQMSAEEITSQVISHAKDFDLTILNYANPDMVGHTGVLESTLVALEVLDKQLSRLVKWAEKNKITVFITADHGNAEVMLDENNKPVTKHTSSPVMLVTSDKSLKLKPGKLANIAPTVLDYMGMAKPKEMNENSLLDK